MKLKRKKLVVINKGAAVKKDVGGPLSTNPDDAARILENIRTREVSLVDNAANGRKFLIIKNADADPKDAKLFKDENEETPADPTPKPEPKSEEVSPKEGEENTEGEGEDDGEPVVIEKGEFSKFADAILQKVPISKALAMEQKEMFLAMSDALMQFSFGMDMIRGDLMTFQSSDGNTGFMGQEVVKALKEKNKNLSDAQFTALVVKRGKKMKTARMDKLKGIMSSLDTLIKELEDDESITKGGLVVKEKTEGVAPKVKTDSSEAITKEAELKKAVETVTKAEKEGKLDDPEVKKSLELLATDKKERESITDAILEKQKVADAQAIVDKASQGGGEKPLTKADLDSAVDAAVEKHVKPLSEKIEKMADEPETPSGTEGEGEGEGEEVKKNTSLFKGVLG